MTIPPAPPSQISDNETNGLNRRTLSKWSFIGLSGALGAAFGLPIPQSHAFFFGKTTSSGPVVNLGEGDIGVLNYAYALEQLEAAFYTQVLTTPYQNMSPYEHQVLTEIRGHEIAHREFLKKSLGQKRIPDLQPNFSVVQFNSRQSVLSTAKTFEDIGVSAYNGAGQLLENPKFLLAAGEIVSVEARHASIIRDILEPLSSSFAGRDVVDANGLDGARSPAQVLPLVAPFIDTPIAAARL